MRVIWIRTIFVQERNRPDRAAVASTESQSAAVDPLPVPVGTSPHKGNTDKQLVGPFHEKAYIEPETEGVGEVKDKIQVIGSGAQFTGSQSSTSAQILLEETSAQLQGKNRQVVLVALNIRGFFGWKSVYFHGSRTIGEICLNTVDGRSLLTDSQGTL